MTAAPTAISRSSAPAPASADATLLANAIRALAMDAVQAANSGHPGMPMGMAEIAVALWQRHLRHNPANPDWPDRDRFVLSNGHGSMLQYALLHLTGYALPLDELKRFRQLGSKTPGHPERGATPGVETTTGPLGQGLANGVGMALAERLLAAEFNRPGHALIDHRTYVFVGDGCLMEGISHEACSLAGTLGLGKLTILYDDNGISIDGETKGWFTDDTPQRFAAYGWHVIRDIDGHDVDAVDAAIRQAQGFADRPTLICCKTIIGKGSPNRAGTELAHGQALGEAEVELTRKALGWKHPAFEIPDAVYEAWDARERGRRLEDEWNDRLARYRAAHPELAAEFLRRTSGALPAALDAVAASLVERQSARAEAVATRKASQQAIEALSPALPELIGGSADLTGSVLTHWSGSRTVTATSAGNYVYYGVREFAMSAIANGLAAHGAFIPYVGTFLTFSDYARNAVRMAALMRLRVIFVYTHDSIGLGEDGPTHQAIEHASALRLIPRLDLWRPCDSVETAVAWRAAIERDDGPTCLLFTRQNLPFQKRGPAETLAIGRGGYVLADWGGTAGARVVIIATGSEIALAMGARDALRADGIAARVVSMPCTSVFDRQDADYRERVLPPGVARVSVEAGVTDYWRKYVGIDGEVVGIDSFGESAPANALFKHFGFTVDRVAAAARQALGARDAARDAR
ncbi:MAG TPA: transketolase [Casimicrobiaceae bacterium]|nr:transketolase [Casimicrobiaceae bacterium]